MRAAVYDRYGSRRRAVSSDEVPMPAPGDDDVLVRVHAAATTTGCGQPR